MDLRIVASLVLEIGHLYIPNRRQKKSAGRVSSTGGSTACKASFGLRYIFWSSSDPGHFAQLQVLLLELKTYAVDPFQTWLKDYVMKTKPTRLKELNETIMTSFEQWVLSFVPL